MENNSIPKCETVNLQSECPFKPFISPQGKFPRLGTAVLIYCNWQRWQALCIADKVLTAWWRCQCVAADQQYPVQAHQPLHNSPARCMLPWLHATLHPNAACSKHTNIYGQEMQKCTHTHNSNSITTSSLWWFEAASWVTWGASSL